MSTMKLCSYVFKKMYGCTNILNGSKTNYIIKGVLHEYGKL